MEDDTQSEREEELDTSWYPTSVEELHELLTFYRKQTMVFKKERTESEKVLKSLEMTNEEKHKLEWALHKKSETNHDLNKQLSDVHVLLYTEKNSNIELQSEVKSLNAEIAELTQNKEHLLELLQSANDSLHHILDEPKKHRDCGACTHHHKTQRIIREKVHRQNHPEKLTTIYLPNDPADTLRTKLAAKEEELTQLQQQWNTTKEYLLGDLHQTQQEMASLRKEYDSKLDRFQNEIETLSRDHSYNLREYLLYRRTTKQEMYDIQIGALQMKQERNATKEDCINKVEDAVKSTNRMEKELKKRSSKMIHGFRMETIKKHEELNHVKHELKALSKSYQNDVKQLKTKLSASKRRNKKLNQRNKCQKTGIQTDVEMLKRRMLKMQKSMNQMAVDAANDPFQAELQGEIDRVRHKLMELARVTESS